MALRPTRPQTRAEQLASRAAERDAAQQEAFMREVDDALREDQFMTLLRRYGKPAAGAVVLGLAGLGGFLGWQHYQQTQAEKRAEQLTLALDDMDAGKLGAAGLSLAQIAKDGGDGSRAVAQLTAAGIAVQQNKIDDAARQFAAVAADAGAPQPLRDLASLREVSLRFDKMPPQEVIARMQPLAVAGNPWFGPAGELVGMAYLKQGQNAKAAALFGAIAKDKDIPDSLRSRVRQMAGFLGFDAVEDVSRVPAMAAPAAGGAPAAGPAPAGAAAPQPAPQPAATRVPARATPRPVAPDPNKIYVAPAKPAPAPAPAAPAPAAPQP
ncbi:tetratricopeptide repeat protein [Novosphingobium ovatum]|uniref:tetratricopeptide repeat protein n=1 Tax=Novosphingobium ovatum TaxID=1908523 RepID=UPI001D1148A5|nr:tetratricopeptide repeat protein [Novosphingobium ovatum]